ncbi:MAG TPA: TIGR03618 family F420-dependent PPOX class oxidoreductase [Dehalococcoidia bacterium]|nr:TIGR03618 family F420-dependent PPOX class oxidoreductase [Dehalococcoidia bacterium]
MAAMTPAQRDAFLRQPRIAMLITLYDDGAPAAVPVWFEWEGERARIFTGRGSEKIHRVQANARVALCVAEPAGVPEAWVTIEGTAAVLDGGWALAQRLAPRYYRAGQAAKVLAEWGRTPEQWVVIEITPRRIRSLAP